MLMNQRRTEIERFCYDFINGNNNNTHLHHLIDDYRHLLAQIDIEKMNLSKDTFNSSFQTICADVFTIRSTHNAYIIAILGYAMRINDYYQQNYCSWYDSDILIKSLTITLERIDFNPNQFTATISPTYCILV